MKDIAVFGGTFNPVHKGHVHLLKEIADTVRFDEILIIPSKIPPHKECEYLADENDRMNMARLAFSGFKNVKISDIELKMSGRSYTVNTLRKLRLIYPPERFKLNLIIGSDMLKSFKSWYRYEEILSMASLICAARNAGDKDIIETSAKDLRNNGGSVRIVPVTPFEVSSTQIRKMIKNSDYEKLSCYLDDLVVKYIKERGIYSDLRR